MLELEDILPYISPVTGAIWMKLDRGMGIGKRNPIKIFGEFVRGAPERATAKR